MPHARVVTPKHSRTEPGAGPHRVQREGYTFEEPLRLDILVDDCLLLELKSVETVHPIHKAQLLSYMKLLKVPIGLILNFHEIRLSKGISRMILPGANQ
jgi:GxxExxY protein